MGFADFLRTMFDSINPNSYADLSTRSFKDSMEYFFSILFLSFIIMILLLLPALIMIPKSIETTMNDFSKLSADITIGTTKPIEIPTKKPYMIIDTTGTHQNLSSEKILVTGENVFIKDGFCFWFEPACLFYPKDAKFKNTSLSDYSDLKAHSKQISQLTTTVLMFAAPTFLIFLFFLLAIKYAIIILLVSIIALIFARLTKKDVYFSRIFRAATYGSTIMIVLEVALLPFKFKLFMIPFFVFLILIIIGTYLLTEQDVMRAEIDNVKSDKQSTAQGKPKASKAEDEFIDLSKSKLKKVK